MRHFGRRRSLPGARLYALWPQALGLLTVVLLDGRHWSRYLASLLEGNVCSLKLLIDSRL